MLEIAKKNINVLKDSLDNDRYLQEEQKKKYLQKKIGELREEENKLSEEVAKLSGKLDHNPASGLK
jgi:seryl-tRNA synthetase